YGYRWTGTYPGAPQGPGDGPDPGTYLDPLDQSTCQLMVGGSPVNFNNPLFNMDTFEVTYDSGKRLTFTEATPQGIGYPTYELEQPVGLWLNYGTGFNLVFSGQIKERANDGRTHQEKVTYTAYGIPQLADQV